MKSTAGEEVVGEILDIDLSESQPFKANAYAELTLPIGVGVARKHKTYLAHWSPLRQAWEKVDSAQADTVVSGRVNHFSRYAVLMGSLPLGAYDFKVMPNPFSPRDPWALQLQYKVSSEVSSQVSVRVDVFDLHGDKVFAGRESFVNKGNEILAGGFKADPNSPDRLGSLAARVWDGRDTGGKLCRNGRYVVRLTVRDGQSQKSYLKKVVLLK
jgi:hypothetical protein